MLATKLDAVALQIGKGGALIAVVTVIIMIIVWAATEFSNGGKWDPKTHPGDLVSFFITGVRCVVCSQL